MIILERAIIDVGALLLAFAAVTAHGRREWDSVAILEGSGHEVR